MSSSHPRHEFAKFDIVLFDKNVYKVDRTWLGYIVDETYRMDGSIVVRWWDDELESWTGAQSVPRGTLIFIGTVNG